MKIYQDPALEGGNSKEQGRFTPKMHWRNLILANIHENIPEQTITPKFSRLTSFTPLPIASVHLLARVVVSLLPPFVLPHRSPPPPSPPHPDVNLTLLSVTFSENKAQIFCLGGETTTTTITRRYKTSSQQTTALRSRKSDSQ